MSADAFRNAAAARALIDLPDLSAEDVARKAMKVAAEMCVYTNENFMIEVIDASAEKAKAS
jgi:ATP-dependent HslUV protease, peptidase subunit HslV